MDVDLIDELVATQQQQQPKRPAIVPVDDAHPFDLESYISGYSGRTAIDRLIQIVKLCPDIAPEAFNLAVQHIHQSRDPSLYQALMNEYEHLAENQVVKDGLYSLPNPLDIAHLDAKWVDEVTARNQSEKVKLEVELKTYTNNMIKESIRMAHRDLAEFFRSIGEYQQSLRHHTKSREFCATSQHVLDMCLSVLELLMEQRNYGHLSTYVFKAEAALDATAVAAVNAGGSGTTPTSTVGPSAAGASGANVKKKTPTEREIVQSRLELASALSYLGQGSYEKAAQSFLRIGSAKELGDWIGKLITPSDIAIYGTLCALASMSRAAIKAQLLDNAVFGVYIEQEPYIRELLEAYINSNFKTALELLSRYSTRHYVDIHLSQHVTDLTIKIKNSAVVLYFQPFASIKLGRMGEAFGWTVDMVEQHVVNLIQSGEIQGRVDSQNKVLYAKKTDYRADLFARTIQAGNDILSANRKVLLRMRLQQADLIVKPPKGHTQQFGLAPDHYPE
ncbi:COP9 signalosome complex subunit 1 [Leucoagaricus sp. SymC.cos]|nr:COP9 signalosome complex subunit 1 [Leucoagaricus sp. SymC.cos]